MNNRATCSSCKYNGVENNSKFCPSCGQQMGIGEAPPVPGESLPRQQVNLKKSVSIGMMKPITYTSSKKDGESAEPIETTFDLTTENIKEFNSLPLQSNLPPEELIESNIPQNPPGSFHHNFDELPDEASSSKDFPNQERFEDIIKEVRYEDEVESNNDEGDSNYAYRLPIGINIPKWSLFWWILWLIGWVLFFIQGAVAIFLFYHFVVTRLFAEELPFFSVGQMSRGWISIGQFAEGVFCLGQMTFCVVAVGQINISVCGCGQVGVGILFFIAQAGLSCGISGGQIIPGSCVLFSMLSLGCFNYKSIIGFNLLKAFFRCGKNKEMDPLLKVSPLSTCLKVKKDKKKKEGEEGGRSRTRDNIVEVEE